MKANKYVGMEVVSREGYKMTCLEADTSSAYTCTILFEGQYTPRQVKICSFLTGSVKNRNHKSVCGVGYLGYGEYSTNTAKKREKQESDCYHSWRCMLRRIYGDIGNSKSATYQNGNVVVCEEWFNFQNFAKWFYTSSNYREGWVLDKDLLGESKVYSPTTSLFVPPRVNLFISNKYHNNTTGRPGVVSRWGRYVPRVWYKHEKDTKLTCYSLGTYSTLEEAYVVYLDKKIELSDVLADEIKKKYALRDSDILIRALKAKYRKEKQELLSDKKEVSYE